MTVISVQFSAETVFSFIGNYSLSENFNIYFRIHDKFLILNMSRQRIKQFDIFLIDIFLFTVTDKNIVDILKCKNNGIFVLVNKKQTVVIGFYERNSVLCCLWQFGCFLVW